MIYKFHNKFRIPSTRLPHWDYSSEGYYFVTICTKNKESVLGEIKNGEMILSTIGKIAKQELLITEKIRNNVNIDYWVIMPNHIHVILIIQNVETRRRRVSTKFGNPVPGSLPVIINQFKGAVTRNCKFLSIPFSWQSNYYEHIIRNDRELLEIREYIENNPLKWELDEENPDKNNNLQSVIR